MHSPCIVCKCGYLSTEFVRKVNRSFVPFRRRGASLHRQARFTSASRIRNDMLTEAPVQATGIKMIDRQRNSARRQIGGNTTDYYVAVHSHDTEQKACSIFTCAYYVRACLDVSTPIFLARGQWRNPKKARWSSHKNEQKRCKIDA